jgi:hypothetical protein
MKNFFSHTLACIIPALFGIQPLTAQVAVQGVVKSPDNKPVPGATVLLLANTDSVLVKGTITGAPGDFRFENIPPGNYVLNVSMTGYKNYYHNSFSVNGRDVLDAGTLILNKESVELEAVTVSAKKPLFEQKIDRMLINVQSSITSAGSTALEVLEKSPGVVVNRQTNTIALSGKSGVVLMINGKLTYMPMEAVVQMLSGMNASNIDRIELITTPPANFDAEGNAGFINIVMLSNPNKGLNGTYSFTMGYGNGYSPAAALNVNYRNKKINLFGDYSFTRKNQLQNWDFFHSHMIQSVYTTNTSHTERHTKVAQHVAHLGMDYQLSKKTVVGAVLGGLARRWDMTAYNDLSITKNNVKDSSVAIINTELNQWKHFMGNINFSHAFREGENISADLDYLYFRYNNPNDYINQYFDASGAALGKELTRSTKITPFNIWAAKIDYTKKLNKNVSMEAGSKLAISSFTNDVAVETLQQSNWIKDPELTSKFHLKEKIAAVYASFSVTASKKTNLKMGLRYEYTTSNLGSALQQNIIDRKYGRFFPSIFISHQLDENNSVNFSYIRRITRPTFRDMAPFVIFIDPYTFFSGNSGLQPALSNSIKADYLLKNFIFSLSYTSEDGSIAGFQPKISADNKQIYAAENLKNIKTINASLSLPLKITSWWNMQNNIMANWQKLSAVFSKGPFSVEQKFYSFNSAQNFTLPRNYSMELSGNYQSRGLFGAAVVKPFWMMNYGIQKKLKDNSKLRFSVNNIFETGVIKSKTDIPSENIYSTLSIAFFFRTYSLNYSYNFGNKKLKDKRTRGTASDEEQGRLK